MDSEIQDRLDEMGRRISDLKTALRVDENLEKITEIEAEMARPGFWDDQEKAQARVREFKDLKGSSSSLLELEKSHGETTELMEMAHAEEDRETLDELVADLGKIEARVRSFSIRTLFSGKDDSKNAFLSIQAGAGGTDAFDWAEMLLRMYTRWCEQAGFDLTLVEKNPHEEAGIKSATLNVKGRYAYGHLKSEMGTHRLVRISPFDAGNRRHTSFASVDVVPQIDEAIQVEISDSDLRIDTYRSSGAGGQHVNVTDSAVRITHLPTKIAVQCQNERSQHANRRVAMAMLQAKLYQIEQQKRDDELARAYGEKADIAFGNQIRSYWLQPEQRVKDKRTGVETGNVEGVLDGDLDPFIEAYLKSLVARSRR